MVVVLVVLLIITLILGIYSKYEERERSRGQRANYPRARLRGIIVHTRHVRQRSARIISVSKISIMYIARLAATFIGERSCVITIS